MLDYLFQNCTFYTVLNLLYPYCFYRKNNHKNTFFRCTFNQVFAVRAGGGSNLSQYFFLVTPSLTNEACNLSSYAIFVNNKCQVTFFLLYGMVPKLRAVSTSTGTTCSLNIEDLSFFINSLELWKPSFSPCSSRSSKRLKTILLNY